MFLVEFYIWREKLATIFRDALIVQNGVTIVRPFLWVSLFNSFNLKEKAVWGVYEVDEFESIIKIMGALFLQEQVPISPQNSCITPERWVVRSRASLHRVPRQILHMERANWLQFWRRPNCPKCLYYIVRPFLWVNL